MNDFKINREKKTFVFDDGEEIPIPQDKVRQVLRTPAAKKYKQEIKESHEKFGKGPLETFYNQANQSFLGNTGQTAANYVVSAAKAFSPGEGQKELSFIDRIKDNFYAAQEAGKENLQELSELNPTASALGKGVGTVGEIAALRKFPGVAAVPVMGAAHSETSFLEPQEKGKEIASDAAVGFLLDRFFKGAQKIAGARKDIRTSKQAIQEAEAINAAEMTPEAIAKRKATYGQQRNAYETGVAQHEAAIKAATGAQETAIGELVSQKGVKTLGGIENTLKETLMLSEPIMADLEKQFGTRFSSHLSSDIEKVIHDTVKNEKNLLGKIQNGQLQVEIANQIQRLPRYRKIMDYIDKVPQRIHTPSGQATPNLSKNAINLIFPGYENMQISFAKLPENMGTKFSQTLKGEINSIQQSIKPPTPPNIAPPQFIPPNLVPVPPPVQPGGIYGKLASGLENMSAQNVKQSIQQNAPLGIMAKLAGIPLAKGAAGAAIGTMGINALTSPTVGGNALRKGLEHGGRFLQSIWAQAEKYPSFHDGILENPQERRSLTKEIEDVHDMPVEEKALYQSKINRGRPLDLPLQ